MIAKEFKGYSVSEVAKKEYLTRQAVYLAIHKKNLKASKFNGHWIINKSDVSEWKKNKHSRQRRIIDGKPLFSDEYLDVKRSAEIKKCPTQSIYYAIYNKKLNAQLIANQYVIHIDDLEKLRIETKSHKRKAS